ncbi:hypothetical protein GCM10020000_52450 [Streptomyces olivoverticillatus]
MPFTSLASLLFTVCRPLAVGGTGVYRDVWDPGGCLDLMAEAGVNQVFAPPVYWTELLAAQRDAPRDLGALRLALSGGRTGTPAELLAELPGVLGAEVRTVWGTPEAGMATVARGETPAERRGRATDGRCRGWRCRSSARGQAASGSGPSTGCGCAARRWRWPPGRTAPRP